MKTTMRTTTTSSAAGQAAAGAQARPAISSSPSSPCARSERIVGGIVGAAEDRGSRDEGVRARRARCPPHSPSSRRRRSPGGCRVRSPRCARAPRRACRALCRNELLSAEARIHRHHQDGVDLVDHVVEPVERRGRIEHEARVRSPPRGCAGWCDPRAGWPPGWKLMRVAPALAKSAASASTGETIKCTSMVGVDARLAQRLAYHRADGEIRHVMIVHHVEMNPVRARGEHRLHFLAQAGKIGRQDRRRDADGHAAHFINACRAPHVLPRRPPGCAGSSPWPTAPSIRAARWRPACRGDDGSFAADTPW